MKKYLIMSVIMTVMIWTVICIPCTINAKESFNNKAEMLDNGKLIYSTTDTKHTSNIRWRTVGFVISKKKYNGYPVVTKSNKIMITQATKTSVDMGNGKLKTTFKWSREFVIKAMEKAGITHETLQKEGGRFYLNAIIEVYNGKTGKVIGGRHYNIHSIKTAQGWKNPNDFKDHYDIEVGFPYTAKVPVRMKYFAWIDGEWKNVTSKAPGYVSGSYVDLGERSFGSTYKVTSNQPSTLTISQQGKAKTFYLFRSDWSKIGQPGKLKDKKFAEGSPFLNEATFEHTLASKVQKRTFSINSSTGIVINYYYKKYAKPKQKTEMQLEPDLTCTINSNKRNEEIFNSELAIPTTEDQYVWVTCKEFLYKISYTTFKGTSTYTTKKGTFKRRYYFTKITKADIWRVDRADVTNKTLPGEHITIYSDFSEYQNGDYVLKGIVGKGKITKSPEIDDDGNVGYYYCMSDYLYLEDGHGNILINVGYMKNEEYKCDGTMEGEIEIGGIDDSIGNSVENAGLTVGDSALYKTGLKIPMKTQNGEYQSKCSAYYMNLFHYKEDDGSNGSAEMTYDIFENTVLPDDDYKELPSKVTINSTDNPESINPVTVLTPVVCDGLVSIDKSNNQELTPAGEDIAQIVLDHQFSVYLPTVGWHSNNKGYGERDYKKYTNKREVKFNFDTYSKDKQTFYPKNTWIELTEDYTSFYLPVWVDETFGDYAKAKYRATAINNISSVIKTESLANEDGGEFYGAHDITDIHISGSIFGLNLYDISDYPLWQNVFREDNSLKLKNYRYNVGTNDKNGLNTGIDSKCTFPILEGSHRFYLNKGALKTGYAWRFSVKTIGNYNYDNDCIRVKPEFYYVKPDGTREKVDIWYTATGAKNKKEYLVKVGSEKDYSNRKSMSLGDPYTSVPENEIEKKAELTGKTKDELKEYKETYCYGRINVGENMRTYIGENYIPNNTLPASVAASKAAVSVQKWYFQYHLPGEIHICEKDFDVIKYGNEHNGIDYKEDFWIKEGGYLDVNFDITTVKGTGHNSLYSSVYSMDITDSDDPVYSDLYNIKGEQVWTAKSYDSAFAMSETEIHDFENMYNSYLKDGEELYTDKQEALDAGSLADDLKEYIKDINDLEETKDSDDMEITKDPFKMGTEYLSYINSENALNGYCNMWKREGFDYNKEDVNGNKYSLKDGDVLFCYIDSIPNKSVDDDYKSSGTN